MKRWMRNGWAALLALWLFAAPALGVAEVDYDAGTLLPTLKQEAYVGGREIVETVTLRVSQVTGMEPDLLAALQEAVEMLEIRISSVDDMDAKLYAVKILMAGEPLLDATVRWNEERIYITSSQLPGKTVTVSMAEAAKHFPVHPLLTGKWGADEDMALLENQYIDYFAAVGGWVSNVQSEHEDLYAYEFTEMDETESRDASTTQMYSTVRSDELKKLIRDLANLFFEDENAQQAFANILAPYGATQASVRHFADQLPLVISHELGATRNSTEFTVFYDDNMDIVGFDGTMPAMYTKFFFDYGALQYSRKTLDEGVRHDVKGTMEFAGGATFTGESRQNVGDLMDDQQKTEQDIAIDYQDPANKAGLQYTIHTQEVYTAQEGLEVYEGKGNGEITRTQEGTSKKTNTEMTLHGETKPVGDWDFAHTKTIQTEVEGQATYEFTYTMISQEYVPADLSGNVAYDLETLTEEQRAELENSLQTALMQAYFQLLAKLPSKLVQSAMRLGSLN